MSAKGPNPLHFDFRKQFRTQAFVYNWLHKRSIRGRTVALFSYWVRNGYDGIGESSIRDFSGPKRESLLMLITILELFVGFDTSELGPIRGSSSNFILSLRRMSTLHSTGPDCGFDASELTSSFDSGFLKVSLSASESLKCSACVVSLCAHI